MTTHTSTMTFEQVEATRWHLRPWRERVATERALDLVEDAQVGYPRLALAQDTADYLAREATRDLRVPVAAYPAPTSHYTFAITGSRTLTEVELRLIEQAIAARFLD